MKLLIKEYNLKVVVIHADMYCLEKETQAVIEQTLAFHIKGGMTFTPIVKYGSKELGYGFMDLDTLIKFALKKCRCHYPGKSS